MSNNFRALILLTVILWQSVAMFGPVILAQRAGELEHMTVHVQNASHHHHVDRALHMEDDASAVQHLHADAGTSATGLLTSSALPMRHDRLIVKLEATQAIWRSASLEGPLRPPRLTA